LPHHGIQAFEFRIINARPNQLIDVQVTVMLSQIENNGGRPIRRFHDLPLERKQVKFFPLHWTVVHPINQHSPLQGVSLESLSASDAEFLILLTAIDEDFSQTVHARSSYKHDEVVVGAVFGDMFQESADGIVSVDVNKLDDVVKGEQFGVSLQTPRI